MNDDYLKKIALTPRERFKLFEKGVLRGPGRVELIGALSPDVAASLRERGVMVVNPRVAPVKREPGKRTWTSLKGLTPEQKEERKRLQQKEYRVNVQNN